MNFRRRCRDRGRAAVAAPFFLSLFLGVCAIAGAQGLGSPLLDWRYAQGDAPERARGDFQDRAWAATELPAKLAVGAPNGYLWLRCRIPAEALKGRDPLFLSAGKLDMAAQLFVNGSLVGERGSFPPLYASNANDPAVWLVPRGLLRGDGDDVIALRLYVPSSIATLRSVSVVDRADAAFLRGPVFFLNVTLYGILAAVCGFVGLYFFMLWMSRRSDTPFLWYALSSLSIAYYFAEMGSQGSLILPYALNRAVAKGLLGSSMSALTAFFLDHFKMRRPRWLGFLLAAAALGFLAAAIASYRDFSALDRVFNVQLIWVQLSIVFAIYSTVRGVLRGDSEAKPLLAGVILGVAFGTYDVVHSAMGIEPLAWLQGIGFFAVNVSLFASLTLRSGRESRELGRYAQEAEGHRAELSSYVDQLGSAADLVGSVSERVASDASDAAGAAEVLSGAAGRMAADADRQAGAVEDSSAAVQRLVDSLSSVLSEVDSQAEGIEEAAKAIDSLSSNAADVDSSAERTSSFTSSLEADVVLGREAVRSLSDAIAKISDTSRGIEAVVAAVEDFAERTNLLAMNAAIEAAHAGNSGRGFAVIATEIKKLAIASAEKAASIRQSVAEIGVRIEKGVDSNDKVREVLQRVSDGASASVQEVSTLASAAAAQRDVVSRLAKTLDALGSAAAVIRGDASRQEEEGVRMKDRLGELVAVTEELRNSISRVASENGRIVEATRKLAAAASEGRDSSVALRAKFTAASAQR